MILSGFALLGFSLGHVYLALRKDANATKEPASVISARPMLTDSLRTGRAPESSRDRALTAAREAYHLPEGEIETSITLYAENGWWDGLVVLFRRWAKQDPEAAFEKAFAIEWASSLSERRYGQNTMSMRTDFQRQVAIRSITEAWFAKNPERAMRALLEAAHEKPNDVPLEQAIDLYADHDPAAAYQIAQEHLQLKGPLEIYNHHYGGSGESFASDFFTKWARRDPSEAAAHALDYEDRSIRAGAQAGVFKGWLETDSDAAQAWVDQLDASQPLKSIQAEQVKHLALTDPLRAMAESPQSTKALIRDLVERDGSAVLQLVEKVEQPEVRRMLSVYGTELLADRMLGSELGEAVLRLPKDVQTGALRMLAAHWYEDEPEAAHAFVGKINDPVLRRYYLAHLQEK